MKWVDGLDKQSIDGWSSTSIDGVSEVNDDLEELQVLPKFQYLHDESMAAS